MYEVTARSVTLGLVFCAIFSMAAAYLALKVGQGIEDGAKLQGGVGAQVGVGCGNGRSPFRACPL